MKKFLDEFKQFALRGNVIDMAIGVVIGSAFSKITSSLVNDLIMPFFAMMCGNVNFTELKVILKETLDAEGNIVSQVTLNYGQFIQNIVDFVLIALCLFMVVKFMNSMKKKEEEAAPAPAPAPVKSDETVLLEEIRDLLKNK